TSHGRFISYRSKDFDKSSAHLILSPLRHWHYNLMKFVDGFTLHLSPNSTKQFSHNDVQHDQNANDKKNYDSPYKDMSFDIVPFHGCQKSPCRGDFSVYILHL